MERMTIEETAECRIYELWVEATHEELEHGDTIPCPPPSATEEEGHEVLNFDLGAMPW